MGIDMKHISILTIAPEMFDGFFRNHVIERAIKLGLLEFDVIDLRGYADGCFRKVDDSPYGGGAGMILRVDPVVRALEAVCGGARRREELNQESICVAALTPAGKTFTQKTAEKLLDVDHLVLICGHYEGMDERILSYADRRISIGDYVLSGGDIAAMAVADALTRLLPGVIKPESLSEESFSDGLLEYPQYTRPQTFDGKRVPEVLLSGNHERIRIWRQEQAVEKTRKYRPDLLQEKMEADIEKEERL